MKKLFAAVIMSVGLFAGAASAEPLSVGGYKLTPYVEAKGGEGFQTQKGYDNQGLYGVAVGVDGGIVAAELEAIDAGSGKTSRAGNVDTRVLGANVYVKPYTFNGFTPYAVGGLGYGWFSGSGVRSTASNSDSIVYNVGLGSLYSITPNWSLDVSYRYAISDKENVKKTSGRYTNYTSNELVTGVRYNF